MNRRLWHRCSLTYPAPWDNHATPSLTDVLRMCWFSCTWQVGVRVPGTAFRSFMPRSRDQTTSFVVFPGANRNRAGCRPAAEQARPASPSARAGSDHLCGGAWSSLRSRHAREAACGWSADARVGEHGARHRLLLPSFVFRIKSEWISRIKPIGMGQIFPRSSGFVGAVAFG